MTNLTDMYNEIRRSNELLRKILAVLKEISEFI